LVKQPAGAGDIFFCQKIVKQIQANTQYKKVIWPVADVYSYLGDYMIGDGIEYPNVNEEFPFRDVYFSGGSDMMQSEDVLYLPLQHIHLPSGCTCHGSFGSLHQKYNVMNMDYDDWLDYFTYKRDAGREQALADRLGVDLGSRYNVVNPNYATHPGHLVRHGIDPGNGYPNVIVDIIPGTTLFDWLGVFEHAQEIHTVETSFVYLLESLHLDDVWVYSKWQGINDDFSYMRDNFNRKWRYIP